MRCSKRPAQYPGAGQKLGARSAKMHGSLTSVSGRKPPPIRPAPNRQAIASQRENLKRPRRPSVRAPDGQALISEDGLPGAIASIDQTISHKILTSPEFNPNSFRIVRPHNHVSMPEAEEYLKGQLLLDGGQLR